MLTKPAVGEELIVGRLLADSTVFDDGISDDVVGLPASVGDCVSG